MKTNTSTQLLLTKAVNSLFYNPRIIQPPVCLQGVSVRRLRWPAPPPARLPAALSLLAGVLKAPPGAPSPPCPEHVKQVAGIVSWCRFSALLKAWRLCCPFPASSTHGLSSSLLSFKLFLRESDNKVASVFLCRRSQEFHST